MKLSEIVKTGDLLFVKGDGFISKIIRKVTSGETNHVGVVYDKDTIFETDLSWGKAEMHPISKYDDKKVYIVRLNQFTVHGNDAEEVKRLCEKYNNTPYSVVDIITNLLLSPFNEKIRTKVVSLVGTKKYAICSELSARIIYEAANYGPFFDYEGLEPQDLLTQTRLFSKDWSVILDHFAA